MSTPGIAVPGTNVPSGSAVGPGGAQGIQGLQGVPPTIGFTSKTSAYTVTGGDLGQYFICSGGSWTLTLPAPSLGFYFDVRNDMGISGTTGTITVSPTGGTIDGASSLALLPQQECRLRSDGTNWRTFGLKREVILGIQTISAAAANGSVLLPTGYRIFELFATQVIADTDNISVQFQLSTDGGGTWINDGNYRESVIYDTSVTAVAYSYATSATFINSVSNAAIAPSQARFTFNPGSASISAGWQLVSGGWSTVAGRLREYVSTGYHGVVGVKNALRWNTNSGNIINMVLIVKGIV